MAILSMILGFLMIACGISCIFTPFATFLATGYILCIVLFIYGIFALIRAIRDRGGVLEYITSIMAIVVGIICIIRPGASLVLDAIIAILVAIWFLIMGINGIYTAIATRLINSGWVLSLILGILSVIVAILAFVNPAGQMFAIGFLIGFFLIDTGLGMITLGGLSAGMKGKE